MPSPSLCCLATVTTAELLETWAAACAAAEVAAADGVAAADSLPAVAVWWLEPVSRFSRCRSARISEACWYRRSRSFSNALLMMSSSLGGRSGFRRSGGAGARFRIASKIVAELSPRKGSVPVAIS